MPPVTVPAVCRPCDERDAACDRKRAVGVDAVAGGVDDDITAGYRDGTGRAGEHPLSRPASQR